jgi:hypothetical protein
VAAPGRLHPLSSPDRALGREAHRPGLVVDWARDVDLPTITALVRRHGGDTVAQIAAHWLARQRPGALLVRDAGGAALGCALLVGLEAAEATDPDDAAAPPPEPGAAPAAIASLAEPAFAAAVRAALRDLTSPDLLRDNPLLRSRLVAARAAGDASAEARLAALRALLEEVIGGLGASPRRAKLQRVLHHTYLEPAGSQERVAERLGLPYSTYRDHLRAGLRLVGEILWQRVADAGDGPARPEAARIDSRAGDEDMAIEPVPAHDFAKQGVR